MLTAIFVGLDLGYLTCGAVVLGLIKGGSSVPTARRVVFLAATALVSLSAVVPSLGSVTEAVVAGGGQFRHGSVDRQLPDDGPGSIPAQVSTAAGLLGGSGSLVGALAMWAVGRVSQQMRFAHAVGRRGRGRGTRSRGRPRCPPGEFIRAGSTRDGPAGAGVIP